MQNATILVVRSVSALPTPSTLAMLCVTNLAIGFGIGYALAAFRKQNSHPPSRPRENTPLLSDLPSPPVQTPPPPAPSDEIEGATQQPNPEDKPDLRVTELNIYPIKACAPVRLKTAVLTNRGFQHDRLFMIVDFTGRNLTQKKYPSLTLVRPTILPDGTLVVTAPNMEPLHHTPIIRGTSMDVVACVTKCQAVDQGEPAASFFATYLETSGVRLVRMRDTYVRKVPERFGKGTASFADEFPYLLASEASLKDLAKSAGSNLDMRRFRPNVVVDGHAAWQEDAWKEIVIADLKFTVPKPCVRCRVVTVDPDRGVFHEEGEPMGTLKRVRAFRNTVVFGVNMLPLSEVEGRVVSVGDSVKVLQLLKHVPRPNTDVES